VSTPDRDAQGDGLVLGALTLDEFAARFRVPRSQLFKLLRAGYGPRTYKLGRRRYVSVQAALDWQRDLEAQSSVHR